MKKFLSLVLALVMAMSLVTVSAGAKDFNDSDKISDIAYEEAVNVMSEMGIIDGYGDGNFQPQGTLTRGAAAKIIACMMLGKTTAESLGTQAAPFKDVPVGSTFAGYIAYCSESGIIDGYSDGTFRPGNTLTGFAFLKMLLTALGYDSTIEGYANNANWTVNVAGRAKQVGLLDGNDNFVGTRAATREEACLYAVNALQATLVEYSDKGSSITINGAVISTGASNATYVTSNVYDQATSINDSTDNVKNGWTVEFAEKYQPDLALKDATDAFGRPAHTWTWKKAEIGTYVEYDKMVGEYTTKVTGEDLYKLLSKATIDDSTVYVYVDGETSESVLGSAFFDETDLTKNNDDKIGETGNGVLTQVFLDTAEDEITIAVINTYLAQADEDYNEKTKDLDLTVYKINEAAKNAYVKTKAETETMTVEAEDFSIADVKEDDLFLVTVADGAIQTMVAPEVVSEATVTNFKRTSYVTAGGTQYDYASTAMYDEEVLDQYDDKNMKDVTYNVILDPYGYLIGIELNQDPDQYVFLTGIDLGSSNLAAKNADANVIFMDGKMDTVTVNMKDSSFAFDKVNGHNAQLNTWCTYTVDSKGIYTLEEVAPQTDSDAKPAVKVAQNKQNVTSGTVTINQKNVSLDGAGVDGFNKVYGNDETVYLNVELGENITDRGNNKVRIIDDVESVTTGVKNVDIEVSNAGPDGSYDAPANEIYTLYKNNGYIIAVVTIGENNGISASYAYITSDDVNREAYADGEWTWTREAVVDGKIVELKEVGSTLKVLDELKQGKWYEVKYDANGNVRKVDATNITGSNNYTGIPFTGVAGKFINNVSLVKASVNANDTVLLADTTTVTKLTYKSGTLYTDVNSTKGFSVSPDVKVVLALAGKDGDGAGKDWFDDVDDSYTGYAGLEKALKDMNTQGAFTAGTVEVSALLKSGAATVIVINDKNAPDTTGPDTTLPSGSYKGISWNSGSKEFELRYYKTPLTDAEITNGIAYIVGSPVASMSKALGIVRMENGEIYNVNFTQIEQVALFVDGEIVDYADKGTTDKLSVPGVGSSSTAKYLLDKVSGAAGDLVKGYGLNATADRYLYTAYEIDGVDGSNVKGVMDDKDSTPISNNDYVAAGETIILTFTQNTGDYTLDGVLVRTAGASSDIVKKVEVSKKVEIKTVSDYMTAQEIANVVAQYDPEEKSPTGVTISVKGTTLSLVLDSSVNDITDRGQVKDTGLVDLATKLISKGNTIQISFEDGQSLKLTASNVTTMASMLADNLGTLPMGEGETSTMTVTVTNTASGDYMTYTVTISQEQA